MQRAEIEQLLTKAKELLKPEVTDIAYKTTTGRAPGRLPADSYYTPQSRCR